MSILNVYQLAFLATIGVTVLVAARAKRQMVTPGQAIEVSPQPARQAAVQIPVSMDRVKERIRELDKQFDQNLLTVAEYVEQRKRAVERGSPDRPTSQ